MTEQVLDEMRTFVEAGGLASAVTIRRWLAMLEASDADDPVVADARAQARRDA